ncbi:zinc ribbon domain-containing protein [Oculatella sp. LEGE 06141]|uniref:FmdB family zinc ribbon protein n=1 Tax=Oculatella sp. LEGE 06141 TaxID=1828648 RepID=UPI001880242B|nr:zinc ribbon domain-containing protein [Oculatella sp. LEGE 06141]MBE9181963.1 zinc ribbon domain-containing protein [Oculatella sp. LEGE 06141]
MPLYEFQCSTCGPFEQWRSMADATQPMQCPTCDTAARRIFSPPSLLLSSSLRLRQSQGSDPRVTTRSPEPTPPKLHNHSHGRPWMISH